MQGTRRGDRGRAANDRIRDELRWLAAMPTESMSTPAIALVTSGGDARLWHLKMMIEDTCGRRHASRQQAERPERGRESVRDAGNAGAGQQASRKTDGEGAAWARVRDSIVRTVAELG